VSWIDVVSWNRFQNCRKYSSGDQMFLGRKDFNFYPNRIKFAQILPKLQKFCPNNLLGDAATSPAPTPLVVNLTVWPKVSIWNLTSQTAFPFKTVTRRHWHVVLSGVSNHSKQTSVGKCFILSVNPIIGRSNKKLTRESNNVLSHC